MLRTLSSLFLFAFATLLPAQEPESAPPAGRPGAAARRGPGGGEREFAPRPRGRRGHGEAQAPRGEGERGERGERGGRGRRAEPDGAGQRRGPGGRSEAGRGQGRQPGGMGGRQERRHERRGDRLAPPAPPAWRRAAALRAMQFQARHQRAMPGRGQRLPGLLRAGQERGFGGGGSAWRGPQGLRRGVPGGAAAPGWARPMAPGARRGAGWRPGREV